MKINTIVCPKCKQRIYSRALHDFHWCKCKNVAIDGGNEYIRITAKENIEDIKVEEINLEITPKELFEDWNKGSDKYGWISC